MDTVLEKLELGRRVYEVFARAESTYTQETHVFDVACYMPYYYLTLMEYYLDPGRVIIDGQSGAKRCHGVTILMGYEDCLVFAPKIFDAPIPPELIKKVKVV
jgi:hypothetical protein